MGGRTCVTARLEAADGRSARVTAEGPRRFDRRPASDEGGRPPASGHTDGDRRAATSTGERRAASRGAREVKGSDATDGSGEAQRASRLPRVEFWIARVVQFFSRLLAIEIEFGIVSLRWW